MHWLHRAANNSLSLDNVWLKLGHVQYNFNCDKMLGQNLIPKTITLLMNKILPGVQWHAAPIELTLHRINGRNQSNWKSYVYHSQMYNAFLIESNKFFLLSVQNTDLAWHIQVHWRKENNLQLCYKFQKRPNLYNVLILWTILICSDMRKSDTRIWLSMMAVMMLMIREKLW